MTTAIAIALYIGLILWLVAYVRKAKEERNTLIQLTKAQAERLKEIEDAISASPFVTYPYIYTNATRKY
jgi:F0F1-type ATP synthase membrane subunit b/b'